MTGEGVAQGAEIIFANPFARALVTLLIIIVLQMIVNAILGKVVRHLVPRRKFKNKEDERKREDTLITIFQTGAAFAIWVTGILIILGQLGVSIAALATGAGLLGIVIGFGAQKMIQDFLAGIFIIIEHQYRVGDYITLNTGGVEVSGTVEDISVRITRLRDLDGNVHIISNGAAILATNYTVGFGNVNLDIRVSYSADIDFVEKIIDEVGDTMAKDDKWSELILEPVQFLWVNEFADSSVNLKALGKVRPGRQWDVASEYRRRLKRAFEKHKIEMPFPQMVIHQANDDVSAPKTRK